MGQVSGMIAPLLAAAALACACTASEVAKPVETVVQAGDATTPSIARASVGDTTIHRFAAPESAIFVNAYVVETPSSLVLVDATLTVSSANAFAAYVQSLKKPVKAILITHAHPDHYNGLAIVNAAFHAPVYSTAGVADAIHKIDAPKEAQWKPVFGAEWPDHRDMPDTLAKPGAPLVVDGLSFEVIDVGPAESHADSVWVMTVKGQKHVFIGDVAFNGIHSYMCDQHIGHWKKAIASLHKQAVGDKWVELLPGHGLPGGVELLDHQAAYIDAFTSGVKARAVDGLTPEELDSLADSLEQTQHVKGVRFLVANCAPMVAAGDVN